MARKGGLGRGLDALFQENSTDSQGVTMVRLTQVEPNKNQPRHEFDDQALSELSDSISRYGVLQPLIVRPLASGGYQIVAGERRWRASRMAGLAEIPVIIRELTDSETAELALIENLQREDLTPIEEGEGYLTLINTYGLTQEQVAERVGKSRPAVTNAIRLLSLPEEVLAMLREGAITAGHARAILSLGGREEMLEAARLAASGATVRSIENMAKGKKAPADRPVAVKIRPIYRETELALGEVLGRRVKVVPGGSKGTVQIEFYGEKDLLELAAVITGEKPAK
ncbi:MAG: ParB/RepB/Spo0J family partition protein [Clostridia bacterium]|nr:ParB/RepB/Spo0J family partition protein [Clostridia bacterium]